MVALLSIHREENMVAKTSRKGTPKNVNFRSSTTQINAFDAQCRSYGVIPSEFHRELMDAVIENRVTIKRKPGQLRTITGVHV